MEVRDLIPFALTLVVAGIIIAFGLQVQGEVAGDFTADSLEANASVKAQEGVANLADRLPTIGLIAGIVIIIGLLIGGFAYLMR